MAILGALFRAVVVALAIWVGQTVLAPSNKTGIWAMVSLGIASALAGMLLTRYAVRSHGRISGAGLQFFATTAVLEIFYWLLPKYYPATAGYDAGLAVAVGLLSGLSEWIVPDLTMIKKPRT